MCDNFGLNQYVCLLQVPIDYTWANEILDHELPGMFVKRKSEAAAGVVSPRQWLMFFPY